MSKTPPAADDLVVIGKIGAVHGVRGEVKVHSFTEPMENLLDYPVWQLRRDNEIKQVKLASGRIQGKALAAKIEALMIVKLHEHLPVTRFAYCVVNCLS